MALHVHRSNSVRPLLAALGDVAAAPASPFDRLPVVVHSRGLERYLAMQLADQLGICAHVDFPHPGPFFGEVLGAVLGPEADLGAWSTERLTFAFLDAVADRSILGHPAMAPVAAYLEDASGDRKAAALAGQVATLFERYASYRPELVAGWAAGADDGWEAVLWRALASKLPGSDPSALVQRFEAALTDPVFEASALPRRVAVFSVATLPPLQVRLLAAIARHAEVHLLVYAPSRALWERIAAQSAAIRGCPGMPAPTEVDLTVDHPLLGSCGATARDFEVALLRYAPDAVHTEVVHEPPSDTVLGLLQGDLLRDQTPAATPLPESDSIEVHACHGPIRQVQVLRDTLLRLFDALPDLEPRDVIVMTPDIERWAPLVHAVLGDGSRDWTDRDSHPGKLPRIPYRVADRGVRHENPAAEALMAVLDRVGSRLTASEVMDLLALEPVRARFGISAEELPTLREWTLGSGVRWGLDAGHRAAVDQPETESFTWRFGLDRMLLGQAVIDDALLFDAVPWGETEGTDGRDLLGRFVDFGETLFAELVDLGTDRTVSAWRDRLLALVDRLIGAPGGRSWQREQVREGLARLADDAATAGSARTLDLPAIRLLLEGRFGSQTPGQGFLSGAVTVCQLVPMRAIPFRVVVLLGMDDGSFPRGGRQLAFDRMRARRLGDRSPREDDRALFLEALLAAEERLVVLYSGRDPLRNREQPPAIPVGELLDTLEARFTTADGRPVRDHLTTHHPLQPFSLVRFGPDAGRSRGFDDRMRAASEALLRGIRAPADRPSFLSRELPAPVGEKVLTVDDLVKFWSSPTKRLLELRLGLYERDAEDPLEDREPLDVDALGQWAIRDRLLSERLGGGALTRPGPTWEHVVREGRLPLGEPGRQLYDSIAIEADGIAELAAPFVALPAAPVDLDLDLAGWRLVGRVRERFGDDRMVVQAGVVRGRHVLSEWIRHLAWQASGGTGFTRVLGKGGGVGFRPVGPRRAGELLTDLVVLYETGMRVPLLFFPATSKAWAVAVRRAGEGADLDELARDHAQWRDYDEDDPGRVRLGLRGLFPRWVDFGEIPIPEGLEPRALAVRVWDPALQNTVEAP